MAYIERKKILPDAEYNGFKLRTREDYHDEKIINEIFNQNHYKVPEKMKVVVDIGANIGTMSLLCARRGAKVYAYEPEAFNYETLVYNVKLNKYTKKIKCINRGVGRPGKVRLYVSPINSGATSTHFSSNPYLVADRFQDIELISIHEALKDLKKVDLLKLDCEGSEKEILYDFNNELAEKVDQISVEIHRWDKVAPIVKKMSKWYKGECTHRRIWVFTK